MASEVTEFIERLIPIVVPKTMAAYGVSLTVDPVPAGVGAPLLALLKDPDGKVSVGATVDFHGANIRGRAILATTFGVVAQSLPDEPIASRGPGGASFGDWLTIRDWTGELANQMLGRIRNALLARGIRSTPLPSKPRALSGHALSSLRPRPTARWFPFRCSAGPLLFALDAELDPSVRLSGTLPGIADVGDVLML